MARIYKYQVVNKINELREYSDDYDTDLRKAYSVQRMCHTWTINRAYSQRVELGETLADCMETLDAMIDDAQWRTEQQIKWEAELS
jgi:hypothetical protein